MHVDKDNVGETLLDLDWYGEFWRKTKFIYLLKKIKKKSKTQQGSVKSLARRIQKLTSILPLRNVAV